MFAGSPLKLIAAAIFVLLLVAACVSDLRARRVPNEVVLVLAASGLLFSAASEPVVPGIVRGVGGLLLGLALWLPSWLLRLLGAGDVKLFAAASAWLGPRGAIEAAIVGALVGGLLSLVWMLRYRGIKGTGLALWAARVNPRSLIRSRPREWAPHHLPYTIALATGAVVAAWFPGLLF